MDAIDSKTVLWDNGKPYWKQGSSKFYISPAAGMSMWANPDVVEWARKQGYYIEGGEAGLGKAPTVGPNGVVQAAPNTTHQASQSGGMWRTTGTWSPQSGQYESGVDWGNVLTMVIGGVLTVGAATAMMGGSAAASSAATTAASTGSVDAGLAAGSAAGGAVGAPTIGAAATSGGVGIAGIGGGAPVLASTAAPTAGGWATAGKIASTALGGRTGGSVGAWDWVGPAINTGVQLYNAKQQTDAYGNAINAQTDAQKYSADLQAKATAESLAFGKQQAETDWRNQETARRANYGQWLPREQRISAFGQTVGLPARSIPDYVPGIDPNFQGGSSGTIAGAMPSVAPNSSGPSVNSTGDIAGQVSAYFKARGVTPNPSSVGYWVSKWPELEARGRELGDPSYPMKRLAAADEFGGGGAAAPGGLSAPPQLATSTPGYMQPVVSPALQMPGTISWAMR